MGVLSGAMGVINMGNISNCCAIKWLTVCLREFKGKEMTKVNMQLLD